MVFIFNVAVNTFVKAPVLLMKEIKFFRKWWLAGTRLPQLGPCFSKAGLRVQFPIIKDQSAHSVTRYVATWDGSVEFSHPLLLPWTSDYNNAVRLIVKWLSGLSVKDWVYVIGTSRCRVHPESVCCTSPVSAIVMLSTMGLACAHLANKYPAFCKVLP